MLLPDDLTEALEDCRRYMNEAYGCRSGHGTPIHVTLVPPFRLQEHYSTQDLAAAIERGAAGAGLGAADERWTKLRDATLKAILNACPACSKKDGRPFTPHATVANRDIPAGVVTTALAAMNEMNLFEEFPVDNITIFERQNHRWVAAATLEL